MSTTHHVFEAFFSYFTSIYVAIATVPSQAAVPFLCTVPVCQLWSDSGDSNNIVGDVLHILRGSVAY